MARPRRRKPPSPLDEKGLTDLALRYVGRFATTRAKLRSYLDRKVRERGWRGAGTPDAAAIAERFASQGYVDDAGYALAKSRALTARGFGARRVGQVLKIAGIEEADGEAACSHADAEAVSAALRFAERRRFGPFAERAPDDPKEREKALAAMVRAGHGFGLARAILSLPPGARVDEAEIADRAGIDLH
jgi:regulatory protein